MYSVLHVSVLTWNWYSSLPLVLIFIYELYQDVLINHLWTQSLFINWWSISHDISPQDAISPVQELAALAAPPPPPPEDGNPQSPPPAPSPRKTRQKVSALMEPGQDVMVGHRFASAKVTFFFLRGKWMMEDVPSWLWVGVCAEIEVLVLSWKSFFKACSIFLNML